MRFDRLLLISTAMTAVHLPAFAQAQPEADVATTPAAETAAGEDEAIIVTGSRIRRPNIESAVPVISVGAEEFASTGQVAIGDVLNELPALRSTFSQSNSTRFIGTAGLNFLDLRGLGTLRTLVLVNGRRHVSSSEGDTRVDVNTIPTDLVERVDVVTGGSSAIYGSDAIAGVVNFVLKRDFEGIQLRGQYGQSKYGDADAWFVSGTAGTNFADDRGNIVVSAEWAKQKEYFVVDRPTTATRNGLFAVDSDPPGTPNGSDGVADRIFLKNLTSTIISRGGTIASCPASLAATSPLFAARCFPDRRARVYEFQPNGNLIEGSYGTRDLRPLSNNTVGGSGDNLQDYISAGPTTDRKIVNLLGRFEVSDAFEPFFEAKYVRTESDGNQSGPTFNQNLVFSFDNPFINDQARTQLRTLFGPTATTFVLSGRNNLDFNRRVDVVNRDLWRGVLGVRGDFNDDWSYEVSANYGRFEKELTRLGTRIEQRFAFARDAVRDPATGNIVCRVTIDPTARVAIRPGLAPFLAEDVANCVPLNLFGNGAPSQAALDYATGTATAEGWSEQFVVNGFVSGDSSDFFELPGGPIGFALGAEYRREDAYEAYDELTRAGGTSSNAIPILDPPAFEVKELFGELRFPILADRPFFEELTFEAAGRVADYKGSTGTVYAYNAGLSWAPVSDLRFRGNYSRAVRAPNIAELFTPPTQNFAPGLNDPCDVNFIGAGSPTRAANCAAAGIPAGFINAAARASSTETTASGNPLLNEEKSRSITIGAVLTPSALPGFSLTADYYDIKVSSVIATPGPQNVVNGCYDAPTLNNVFCQLFQRQPAGSTNPATGESNAFFFVPGSLQDTVVNFAGLTARGIDVELAYRYEFDNGNTLGTRLTATRVIERNDFPFFDDPDLPDQILEELGDPKLAFNFSADYAIGNLTLGYQMRYLGKMVPNFIEDIKSVGGNPPQNEDYAEIKYYPDVFYHDLRLEYDFTDNVNAYFGIENVFNRLPPFGLTGVGEFSGIYDNRGRFFYAGASVRF